MNDRLAKEARKGKVACLPAGVRDEVCQRLHDGQRGGKICAWLNGLPEVRRVMREEFGRAKITGQNLSEWRNGGFLDWRRRLDLNAQIFKAVDEAGELRKKLGMPFSQAMREILGGKLLRMAEAAADGDVPGYVEAAKDLSDCDHDALKLLLEKEKGARDERKVAVDEGKLALLLRGSSEKLLAMLQDKSAQKIAEGGGSNAEKIESLGQLMYGELWNRFKAQQPNATAK